MRGGLAGFAILSTMRSDDEKLAKRGTSEDLLDLLQAELGGGKSGLGSGSNRYEHLGEVARGGMGIILKVRDRGFRRDLAMKVLPDHKLDLGSIGAESHNMSRFLDEAQVTGQLEHPGVIPVYDVGIDEDGRLYFTMRLVKGITLAQVFDKARSQSDGWTQTRALNILIRVCETMAFAHEKGVVHRDLKPANIMVGRFGETYVMDWGLAKVTGDTRQRERDESMQSVLTTTRADRNATGDSSYATLDGAVMGTPAYMPLEQARGELERLGPRSDVYSVGALLYHLLSGRAPYELDGEDNGAAAILLRVIEEELKSLDRNAPDCPDELIAICSKAMAREPEDRYESMIAFADDLHAYLDDRVVSAYRTGAVVELKKWVRRNRGLAASLMIAVVIAIAGLGGISFVQSQARTTAEKQNALLEASNVKLDEERTRTASARDLARANEEVALANERVALWQSYVGNVGAANAALDNGGSTEARRRLDLTSPTNRGWEWNYLSNRVDGSLRSLTGATTFLYTLDVHPFEDLVASAGGKYLDLGNPDYSIRIWNFETGELQKVFEGHKAEVGGLAFSPGGDAIASSDADAKIIVRDLETGTIFAQSDGLGRTIDFHPGGQWIAATNAVEESLLLWDFLRDQVVARVALGFRPLCLRCSPDGKLIVVGGRDGLIRVFDSNLNLIKTLDATGKGGFTQFSTTGNKIFGTVDLDFSPDGARLASATSNMNLRTWDLATGEWLDFYREGSGSPHHVRWHPSGSWIVSSDWSGALNFWNAETAEPLDVVRGHNAPETGLRFSANGERLLSSAMDFVVKVWDALPGSSDTFAQGMDVPIFLPYKLAFSTDGGLVAWRKAIDQIAITDVKTGELISAIWVPAKIDSVIALQFNGEELLMVSGSGKASQWDARTGELVSRVELEAECYGAAFNRDCSKLAVVCAAAGERSTNTLLQLLEVETGDILWSDALSIEWPDSLIGVDESGFQVDLQFARQDSVLIGSGESQFMAWESETGESIWDSKKERSTTGLAIDPNGEWFAALSFNSLDSGLFIYSIESGELINRFATHTLPAVLDVTPDGSRIVTGNWNGSIDFWSPEKGEVLSLSLHSDVVHCLAFSRDGTIFASQGDQRLGLWNSTPVSQRTSERSMGANRERYQHEVGARVDKLYAQHLHKQGVANEILNATGFSRVQRDAALLEARRRNQDPASLSSKVRIRIVNSALTPSEYLDALEAAQYCIQSSPQGPYMHDLLGGTQYRMGLYNEAIQSFNRADDLRDPSVIPFPMAIFFRAMSYSQSGDADQANGYWKQAERELLSPAHSASAKMLGRILSTECRALLGE